MPIYTTELLPLAPEQLERLMGSMWVGVSPLRRGSRRRGHRAVVWERMMFVGKWGSQCCLEERKGIILQSVLDLEPPDSITFVSQCTHFSRLPNPRPQLHRLILP